MSARRRIPAFTAVLALLAGLLAVLAPVPAVAAPAEIGAGSVHWGIKESWRNYIGAGVIMTGGVTRAADGAFDFPVTAGSFGDGNALTVQLGGTVRFAAYCDDNVAFTSCLLDSTFSGLQLTISADRQELRGDYEGISRDTPGGAITRYEDVVIATIDALGASPVVGDGTTAWPAMPTVAGDGFPLYPVGTTMDPVSLTYAGPGGAPDLGEHWSVPGAPAFTPAATWVGAVNPASRDALVGATALHVVERATSTATALTVSALDPATLQPAGAVEVPLAANAAYAVANDPASDRVFVLTQVRTTVGGVRGGDATLTALTWTGGGYETATVGTITGTAYTLNAMAWNAVANEIAVITQVRGTAADRFTLTRSAGGTGALVSVPIVLPADATDAQRAADLFGSSGPKAGGTLVALRDGSYLAVGKLAEGIPLPARHLVVGAQTATAAFVADTVPTTQPYAAEWNQYFTYELAATAADGAVMLYSANWTGVVGYADVIAGSVRMLANDVGIGVQGYADQAGSDAAHGLDYVLSQTAASIDVLRDHRLVASIPIAGFARDALSRDVFAVLPDGSVIVQVADAATGRRALQRLELTGIAPVVTSDPADRAVTLAAGTASTAIAFQATGTGQVQWQIRPSGATRFADIAGETSPLLALEATVNTDGTQVRAVFATPGGRVATAPATIRVTTAPIVEAQPTAPTVYVGQPYELSVLASGNPAPTVSWQRRSGEDWVEVAAGVDGSRLTVDAAPLSDDGAVYRARLSNSVDTVYSAEVRVSVRERPSVPETTTYTGVVLEWTGAPEWQHRPPNGSAANYFSAGVSDGTTATYRARGDGAEIVQRAADGSTATATWDTRGSHVDAGGQAAQLMRFTHGTAVLDASGAATITWPGEVSVNFYDGLVPFTLSHPRLEVSADGVGSLTADLSGYAGDMSDPDKPKEAVAPQTGVTVATLRGVVVDAQRGFVVTPDFAGVEIDARGGTPQVRSGSGWGSWPQSFVDFHATTHLAAYFYSTGGSMDAAKRPASFAVGFSGATPTTPTTPEVPVVTPPVIAPSAPTTVVPTREGALLWGVKSSFRSYITGPIAKGAIAVSGGASAADGRFRFGQTGRDLADGRGTASYGGAVRFTGHSGVLDLTFSDPQVRIDSASAGALIVSVGGRRTELAALDLSAGTRSDADGAIAYTSVPATLTASGAGVFSYGSSQFYGAGTAMDAVTFVVGADAAPGSAAPAQTVASAAAGAAWVPPADPPARTGLTVDPAFAAGVAAGGEIAASGSGFAPRETDIKVVVYSSPVVLEFALTADENGVAAWRGLLPATLAPGEHTLTFQGAQLALGAPITVLAPLAMSGCTVRDASLDWGFKESFRSYISGSIAHGEWTVADGAAYSTPVFQWRGGTGTADIAGATGQVDFTGTVTFTGHDGLLHTTVGNPRIRLIDSTRAQLLLDVSGLTMDDALAGRTENVVTAVAVPFADIDLTQGDVSRTADTITVTGAATTITAEGSAAFPNYPAGTAFDPIDFSVAVTDCAAQVLTDGDVPQATQPTADAGTPALPVWAWLLIAGIALLCAAAGSVGTVLVMRRRGKAGDPTTSA
ncbi:HtaA domain-containing protein [Microbacterium hominis]|uniref:HtaA domain-containing protein n=1 Tax=Microbacterium TaxID=33882 RepID=UPI00168A4CCD|nr:MULTISPECIES: HtaA domain-containing protein [Microbacterium]QOC24702.1 HtaA domain-containing protein [Microbacterium hominis]QOC28761.1 HtaA domain-containing protein [Microbacterium hominis]QYF98998.1 HtaA domain-containing protein [Microbacterium sp. PAMC21962]